MKNILVDIKVLSKHIDLLLDLSNEFFLKKIEYNTEDSFAFMCLCFLTKQIEHCRSLRFLIDAGQFSDTMLIARTMLEGLVIIAWTYKDSKHYANLWLNYVVISDYKLSLNMDREKISKDKEQKILFNLKKFGELFLTKKAKKNKHSSKFSYSYNWLVNQKGEQIKISKLFEEVDLDLQEIYREMSGWIHWDIGSMGQNINRKFNKVEIRANDSQNGALSLAVAFQSLYGLMETVNHHLNLEFKVKLEKLKNDFISSANYLKKT